MVQFPRYRLTTPPGRDVERLTALRVTPFGHPRISGCLLLLVAYRSLPRPSSPSSSKASAVDPCPLAISPISPSLCPMPLEKDPVRSAAASEVRRRKPAHRCQRPVVTRRQRFAARRRHRLSFNSRAASVRAGRKRPRCGAFSESDSADSALAESDLSNPYLWRYGDSNPRPMACKAIALAT